ncbi:hypothetical protein KP509_21G085400 [Ceratopteris richardii]|nr:hypothetical protein KP509_21G085400 [Ceratopteris richardii]
MFIVVLCLVFVRIIFYAGFYVWASFTVRRQMLSSSGEPHNPENQNLPVTAESRPPLSSSTYEAEPVMIVITPGKEQPMFVAKPDPIASFVDTNTQTQIMSVKASKTLKS